MSVSVSKQTAHQSSWFKWADTTVISNFVHWTRGNSPSAFIRLITLFWSVITENDGRRCYITTNCCSTICIGNLPIEQTHKSESVCRLCNVKAWAGEKHMRSSYQAPQNGWWTHSCRTFFNFAGTLRSATSISLARAVLGRCSIQNCPGNNLNWEQQFFGNTFAS